MQIIASLAAIAAAFIFQPLSSAHPDQHPPSASPAGKPVEGQLNYTCDGEITCRKKGELFPCSLTTYENAPTQTQAEAQARESMIVTCSSRWGTDADACSVDSLACKSTY